LTADSLTATSLAKGCTMLGLSPKTMIQGLGAFLLGRRAPLFVSLAITARCNLQCRYCQTTGTGGEEMTTAEVLALLEEMASCGTLKVKFTGGEPLLRDDLGVLLQRCRSLGMATVVSTNGWLVARRIDRLGSVGRLDLSLDGREEHHDALRGSGAFGKVMEAAQAARSRGIPLGLQAVLTRDTLDDRDLLLKLAQDLGVTVLFQPPTFQVLRGTGANPTVPEVVDFRRAIDGLIRAKREGAPVANSEAGLRHLGHWPEPRRLRCMGGLIMCRIWPDGRMVACSRWRGGQGEDWDVRRLGFRKAFDGLQVTPCDNCWTAGVVEAGCVFSLEPSAVINLWRSGMG
jgi:MoaA/NifB/PqqE/SkfB family radical SAM enzyme